MIDDGAEDLFGGFWPFVLRFAMIFLPLWVYLLMWAANMPMIVSTVLAGSSVGLVVLFERIKLRQTMGTKSVEDNVIK